MAEIDFPSIEERAEVLPATRADVGRRLAQQLAQNRRRAIEHRVILRQPFGVTRGKFRDFRLRRCQSATDFEVTLSRQRKKVREWPLDDRQSMMCETQISDDVRVEQAHRVARRRIAKAGMKFLGNSRAAHDVTPLDDAYGRAGGR